jgi:hypothetical protein
MKYYQFHRQQQSGLGLKLFGIFLHRKQEAFGIRYG